MTSPVFIQRAPAPNRVNLQRWQLTVAYIPLPAANLQAARAWLRNRSAITAKVDPLAVHAPTHAAPMIALRVRHP